MRYLSLLLMLGLVGCRGCSSRPDQPPPLPGESRPGGIKTVSEPDDLRLDQRWSDAVAGHQQSVASAPQTMTRYFLPKGCKRQYQLRYLQLSEVAEGRLPMGSELIAEVEVELVAGDRPIWRWSQKKTTSARIADGKLATPQTGSASSSALVAIRDNDIYEEDGPHRLWSVFTNQPELALTHPALPKKPHVGSQRLWNQRYFPLAAANALRKRKSIRNGVPTPTPQPLSRDVDVRIASWMSVDDEVVAVLESTWEVEDVTDTPLPHEKLQRYKARYLVSERGAILQAIVIARVRHWWSPRPGESNQKEAVTEQELRLIKGCDQITVKPAELGTRLRIDTQSPTP